MPLTLSTDIPQGPIHVVNLTFVRLDMVGLGVTLTFTKSDASGNVLATTTVQMGPAAAAAYCAALKTSLYGQLQSETGLSGVVT